MEEWKATAMANEETELSKAHDALSADWAKQKLRVKELEARFEELSEKRKREAENYHAGIALAESMRRSAEERAEKAEKERDAAEKQLRGYCPACKNYTPNHNEGPCEICKHEYYQYRDEKAVDNWEWRWIKEE